MANPISAARINTILLLVVGLLAGGIVGYIIGHQGAAQNVIPGTVALQLNDVLSPDNAWIVDSLTCPMPGCYNPLLSCQGELPRRIRDWVNSQLNSGRSGDEIRAEIIATHGQNVLKLQNLGKDTTKTSSS